MKIFWGILLCLVSVLFIADQIKCWKWNRKFMDWTVGDKGNLTLPDKKVVEVEILKLDMQYDKVYLGCESLQCLIVLGSDTFLEHIQPIEES